MRIYALVILLIFLSPFSFAETTLGARKMATLALHLRYPCEKYETRLNKNRCDLWRQAMLSDATLSEPEAIWQKNFEQNEKEFLEWKEDEARIRNKIKPKIGMKKDYIYRHVLGSPDKINDTQTSSGIISQWVYETKNGTEYFYFDNEGVLEVIQKRR